MEIQFEWDYSKNIKNKKKHDILFEEAVTVFYDDNALLYCDPEHSEEEERFLLLGYTSTNIICIVSHCYIEDKVIRIISARKATKEEREEYYRYNGGK